MNGVLSLAGKSALVSGGAGGIGSAIVRRFDEAGADVTVLDLPGSRVEPGAGLIECDLRDEAALLGLPEVVAARFERLDVLVHAAGITRDGVLWKKDPRDWSDVIRVNLDSAFHLLRAAVPLMRRSGQGGAIVLISSINGERGKFGQTDYAASKAGLLGLGRSAARELGRFGIRVNMVAPGYIQTAMTAKLPPEFVKEAVRETAVGEMGRPDDVARAVWFLASAMSHHVTGQVLRVDGGQLTA